MTKQERLDAIKKLSKICYDIGCLGMSDSCPGDVYCKIIRKVCHPDYRKDLK